MGRDSNDLYQPPYSLDVQERRVWGTHEVLNRNAPTDACYAICSLKMYANKLTLSNDSTRVVLHLKIKHTDA